MKKLFAGLLVLTLLLCGCEAEPAPAKDWVMDFPGLTWGMTPEEVCDALELSEGEYTLSGEDYLILSNVRMEVFGVENAYIAFRFGDSNGDGKYTFFGLQTVFPHDTDMEAVAQEIADYYGVPGVLTEEEITNDYGEADTAKNWDWSSTALHQDIMSEAEFEFINAQSDYVKRILTESVTTISLTTNTYLAPTLDGMSTRNGLTMSSSVPFYDFEDGYKAAAEAAATTPTE